MTKNLPFSSFLIHHLNLKILKIKTCEIDNLLFADSKGSFNYRIDSYNLRHWPDFKVRNVRDGFRDTESIYFLCQKSGILPPLVLKI